jgi:hypothetical protein
MPPARLAVRAARKPDRMRWHPPDEYSYAYLLGVYLGDGCITSAGRTYQLGVTLDAEYPSIIDECSAAVQLTLPAGRVHRRMRQDCRAVTVEAASTCWPVILPQHGPGRKHERTVTHCAWQRTILGREPEAFLRGLIHSDGCRSVNHFKTKLPSGRVGEYRHPMYFFSNLVPVARSLRASRDRRRPAMPRMTG